jgi:hypothetical protein
MTTNAELAAAFEAAAAEKKHLAHTRQSLPSALQSLPVTDGNAFAQSLALAAIAEVYRGLAEREAEPGGSYHVGNQFPTGHENGYKIGMGYGTTSDGASQIATGGHMRDSVGDGVSPRAGFLPTTITLESERDCGCCAGECRKPLADGTMGVKECAYINPEGFIRWSCGRVTRKG